MEGVGVRRIGAKAATLGDESGWSSRRCPGWRVVGQLESPIPLSKDTSLLAAVGQPGSLLANALGKEQQMADEVEEDIVDVVDEVVDDVDVVRLQREAHRLGIAIEELIDRIQNEIKARL